VSAFAAAVGKTVRAELAAQAEILESECATAMTLQDYDKLDLLCVVVRPGCPPAVASSVGMLS
jgi:hypothetical protein